MGSGLHLRIDSCADGWEVALHGHAIGKVCRIAAFPTRAEAVSRAELEEKERSVPFVVEEAADGT